MTPEQQAEALDAITTAREMVIQGNSEGVITERLDAAIALLQARANGTVQTLCSHYSNWTNDGPQCECSGLQLTRLPNGELAWLRPEGSRA